MEFMGHFLWQKTIFKNKNGGLTSGLAVTFTNPAQDVVGVFQTAHIHGVGQSVDAV